MDDATYKLPKYDWRPSSKFLGNVNSAKLDYIQLFADRLNPRHDQLTKIYAKRKHNVPGPQAYDTTRNWAKKPRHDYEQQKGRQYREDRITEVTEHIKKVKREKSPAPGTYNPKR